MTRIEEFGWRGPLAPGLGRVILSHGDYYHLVANESPDVLLARKKKSAFLKMKTAAPDSMRGEKISERRVRAPLLPMTGDFVRFVYQPSGESLVTEVLPRFSHFTRQDPTARRTTQTLAVNFDVLFIMMSLNENFSLARAERYLALAEDRGKSDLAFVVTKADLRHEGDDDKLRDLEKVLAGRGTLLLISSRTREGFEKLESFLAPQKTIALIGSSGVGKSTLLNTLLGEDYAPTQEIQAWSGKGRHTTTARELVRLPCGALLLDTPGVREIGLRGEASRFVDKGVSSHRFRL